MGNIDIKPAPRLTSSGSGTYCEETELSLTAESPDGETLEYSWKKPDGSITSGSILDLGPLSVDAAGDYNVTGINLSGCATTEVVDVVVNPNPKPQLSVEGDICLKQPVVLTTESAYSEYTWQDGSTMPELQVDTAGFYWVTVTDINNCKASDSIMVICDSLIFEELSIWLPNAFSPDGDNVNDVFRAKCTPDGVPVTFRMLIFNKWGEQIFSSDDIAMGWDGKFKGQACPSDLYTWIVTFTAPVNYNFIEKSPLRGVVMLLK
jgi:gliding motility-associated-like protein